MIFIYRLGYWFFLLGIICVTPFIRKVREGFLKRVGLLSRLQKSEGTWKHSSKRYWFHFSSAGEFEQAIPILERLKETEPDCRIVLTYFSPSATKALAAETNRRKKTGLPIPWDFGDFSPFDLPSSVSAFIDCVKPAAFVAINREIWPEILWQCSKRKIPCYLFAAHFSKEVEKRWNFYRPFADKLRFIGTVDDQSAHFLKESPASFLVDNLGDPRSERVLGRRNQFQKETPWKHFLGKSPLWIGASLWDQDLKVLLPGLVAIKEACPPLRLVIVPHEPSEKRILHWQEVLKENGIPVRRWSHWLKSPDDHSPLLIDQVGLLAELYSVATVVFVGGSFKARVHNVLEPIAYACPVITGPYIANSSEAVELGNQGLLKVVRNSQEFEKAMTALLLDPETRETVSKQSYEFLLSRQGASSRYLKVLLNQ